MAESQTTNPFVKERAATMTHVLFSAYDDRRQPNRSQFQKYLEENLSKAYAKGAQDERDDHEAGRI